MEEIDPAGDPALASRVHEVVRAAYRVEAALIGSDAIPALHESLADLVGMPLRWLAVRGPRSIAGPGEVLGVLGWTLDGETVDIDRLCVDPPWARQGIGRALVGALLGLAAAQAPDPARAVVTVQTGAANAPAVMLYRDLGFETLGSHDPVPGLTVTAFRRSGTRS